MGLLGLFWVKFLVNLFFAQNLCAVQGYYSVIASTPIGTSTVSAAGYFGMSASSANLTGYLIYLNGVSGQVFIDTMVYNGKVTTVGLYTSSNVVISNTTSDNCVIYATGTINCKTISQGASAFNTGSGANGQVTFWTGTNALSGDTNANWDNTNKRLGLGTAVPGQTLDVRGAGAFNGLAGTQTLANSLFLNGGLLTGINGGHLIAQGPNTTTNGGFTFLSARSDSSGALYRMVIDQSGNIGMGATSPLQKLDVRGNAFFGSNTNSGFCHLDSSSATIVGNGCNLNLGSGNAQFVILSTTTTGSSPVFDVLNNSNTAALLFVQQNGNVGVNTYTPGKTLDIVGETRSSTFTFINGITGVTDGSLAPIGDIGEIISSNLGSAQTPPTSGTYVAIATITLTAGDWDISGSCALDTGATIAATEMACGISTINTSNDSLNTNNRTIMGVTISASDALYIPVGPRRTQISSSTVYYLISRVIYTTLGATTWDTATIITARRMR